MEVTFERLSWTFDHYENVEQQNRRAQAYNENRYRFLEFFKLDFLNDVQWNLNAFADKVDQ